MRIGIDARTLLDPATGERAGVGYYTTSLVNALVRVYSRDEFVLFVDHRMPSAVEQFDGLAHVRVVELPLSRHKSRLPFAYSHVVVAQALRRESLDVFHSPAYSIPLQYRRPSVVTVHDLAIYRHPEWFPSGQRFARSVVVPRSMHAASRIIAVSQSTANDVRRQFHVARDRVVVVPEGRPATARVTAAAARDVRDRLRVGEQYVLFVGTLEPRKNIERLVRAFDALMDEHYERYRTLQLVIAGAKGWKHEPIIRAIARARWSSHIRVVGYVSQEEKMALMRDALLLAFPSLWEGFGLPVVEALSVGLPVVTSSVSALPEVAGPGAVYVRPDSVQSIADGLFAVIQSSKLRAMLVRVGKEHVHQFTWKRAAQETHAVYRAVVDEHKKE